MNDTALPMPLRGFGDKEYVQRCESVQQSMREQSIDVLWLSTHPDIFYFTGFLTQFWQSPTRPWYVLLPQSGKPIAVIPSIGEVCMQRTWLDDIRTWSSPDPFDDGVSLLVDSIRKLAGPTPCIGLPMASETQLRCCLNDHEAIRSALPGAHWVDATSTIRATRQIKSEAELAKLSFICQATSRAFATIPDIIRIGMSEVCAFRAFKISCLQNGADDCAYLVGAASSEGYKDIISPPGSHLISSGDVFILDTGCTFDGYYADFDRNFAFAFVDPKTRDAHQRVWDATEAGLAVLQPGVKCNDVFNAMNNVLHDNNSCTEQGASVGRMGHGLGVELTETPSIAAFDETVLRAGMVMTLEPGYTYADGKMMVHEENIVITETGYELLSTRAPRDIPIIG